MLLRACLSTVLGLFPFETVCFGVFRLFLGHRPFPRGVKTGLLQGGSHNFGLRGAFAENSIFVGVLGHHHIFWGGALIAHN